MSEFSLKGIQTYIAYHKMALYAKYLNNTICCLRLLQYIRLLQYLKNR
nr:MAG TPA: hypothetical protein [Caudoviricetes sp.]